jgi:murein DD-endopeptidase MepM/ murein hydrolase activator NlpD
MFQTGMYPKNKWIFLIFGLILLIPLQGFSQKSKAQLEQEKRNALNKLEEAQKILEETEQKHEVSVGQLNALNQQIIASQSVIGSITGEITIYNIELLELNEVIESLESDLDHLKKEYASMVYSSYKANFGLRNILFIFSAETFNQLLLRAKYMDQYTASRKKQLKLIQEVRASHIDQIAALETKKLEKDELLNQELSQNKNLVTLRKKQNSLIKTLSEKESEIKQELKNRKKAIVRLDKLIANIVTAEIKASSKGKSSTKIEMTTTESALSQAFENNYSKLQWPVSTGFISAKFGNNPHPVYKRLKVPNDGIDIQTNENQEVRSVFEGKVKAVAVVPGHMRYVVLIQHGEYFTVYAKLKEVFVSQGSIIGVNQRIGVVNTDKNGTSEVQFQIWKNKQKLNPENWIAKK